MSHDSGFRRPRHTVAPPSSRKPGGGRASRKFERNITKRFHTHEQTRGAVGASEKDVRSTDEK